MKHINSITGSHSPMANGGIGYVCRDLIAATSAIAATFVKLLKGPGAVRLISASLWWLVLLVLCLFVLAASGRIKIYIKHRQYIMTTTFAVTHER